jgi:phage N-6-adenine-methyltransferase
MVFAMIGKSAIDPANSWQTPLSIIDAIGPFDLDPCASPGQTNRCATIGYAGENDGLILPWFGRVFCNPPYGRHSRPWLEKCAAYRNVIALITPKSIGSQWFQRVICDSEILFVQGRIPFVDPITNKPAKANTQWSCLIAWNNETKNILRNCGIVGFHVVKYDGR